MDIAVTLFHQKPTHSQKTLGFTLDDTGKTIVADSPPLSVVTTKYSDDAVMADVSDPPPKNNLSIFGNLIDGKIQFLLDRKTGSATLFGSLLADSAIVGSGTCKPVEPPPAKP